jgi:hypothetical protein
MIKDPFYKEETPYDILGLSANASNNEVFGALVQFMKNPKNIGKLQKAQAADRKLKNVSSRICIDIMYYNLGKYDENVTVYDPEQVITDLDNPIVFDFESFYTDLQNNDFSPDLSPIKERKIVLSEKARMEDVEKEEMDLSLLKFDI